MARVTRSTHRPGNVAARESSPDPSGGPRSPPSTRRSQRRFHLRSIRTKVLGVGVAATILLAGVGSFAAVQLVDVRNHADELAAMQSSVGGALTDLKDATGAEPAAWADVTTALASYRALVGGEMLDAAVADDRELFSLIRAGGAAAAGTNL